MASTSPFNPFLGKADQALVAALAGWAPVKPADEAEREYEHKKFGFHFYLLVSLEF